MSWARKRRDTTDHGYVEERLSAYLDGELSSKERQVVHQHLATCQACQWELDTLRQTVQWTRELPTIPVPHVFTIPAPAQAMPAPRRQRGWVPLLQGATALIALLLVVVVAGDVMLTGALRSGSMLPESALDLAAPPVAVMEQAPVEVAPAQVVTTVEREITLEAEVEAEESAAEPEQAPAPQAAVPAEEPAEAERSEPAEGQPAAAAEAPLAMETTASPPPMPEAEGMTAMGGGSPEVKEKIGEQAETPLAMTIEEAVQESEAVADAVEPTPTVMPTAVPTEQPTATPAATVAPTIVAESREYQPPVVDDQASRPVDLWPGSYVIWLRLAECALGTAFIVLGTITVVVVLRRRRAS